MDLDPGLQMKINTILVPQPGTIINCESEEIVNKSSPRQIFSRKLSLQDYRERKQRIIKQVEKEEALKTARNSKYGTK